MPAASATAPRPAASSRWCFAAAPLPVASSRWLFAAAPLPVAAMPRRSLQQHLCHGAPASNKPHPAEKRTPVRLAIWRTWAGFANSQLRRANFSALIYIYASLYICVHPHCCHLEAAAQTDANLSAHLHRLPTPPPYLRRMRLLHGRVRRYPMGDKAVACPRRRCLVLDDAVAKQGRRCWVANNAAGCSWRSSCKSPRARILVLGTSGAHWPARWPRF